MPKHTTTGTEIVQNYKILHLVQCNTCSSVRHKIEDVTKFGVDVEADVHVTCRQVDDEVRVVIHWMRNTELHRVSFTFNTAAGRLFMIL